MHMGRTLVSPANSLLLKPKSDREIHITTCKIDSQWEFAVWLRKLKQGLCINLHRWDVEGIGGRFKRAGIYVYLWLIHVEV